MFYILIEQNNDDYEKFKRIISSNGLPKGGTQQATLDDVERIIDAYDDGVNEFFNYDTDNAYLEDLDCEEVY